MPRPCRRRSRCEHFGDVVAVVGVSLARVSAQRQNVSVGERDQCGIPPAAGVLLASIGPWYADVHPRCIPEGESIAIDVKDRAVTQAGKVVVMEVGTLGPLRER